jgi:PKD repeat protein
MLVTACRDESQAPPSRPEPPTHEGPGGSILGPLDLVYVCGNKFLATNATQATVQLEYRVVGTDESGSITLRPGTPEGDQSWSETELESRERGVVELYQQDQRVARRRNEAIPCGASPFSASMVSLGPAESGSWSAPIAWPVVALHLHLLPTSKVLSWGRIGDPQLWVQSTGAFTAVPSVPELFCSGHSFLPNGLLLVSGGHISDDHGLPNITQYAPSLQSWSSSAPMRQGRWYPTNTTLANGDVLILAGADQSGLVVGEPEVWSPAGLRVLSTASLSLPYYPRSFLAPNGMVFYAGEEQTTRYLNTSGTGSWTTVGNRLYGTRDYGSAVMYDDGKILYAGGGRTTNTAEIIDLNSAGPTWQWTGSMAFPRRHLNLTVLPTGEVLATGGSSGTTFNDVTRAVHAAEIWNPNTGVWTTVASNSVSRVYHSTTLLLPNGRVLHTGGGDAADTPNELNAELFSPPYLFKGPRPTITSGPTLVGYNVPFRIQTPQFATISKVSLIRLGSVTHAFDMNQRFQWLTFTRDAGGLIINAPTSSNRTPPGHYMLFILDGNNVPSLSKMVNVGAQSSQPANMAPTADFSVTCTNLSCSFTDRSTDGDGSVAAWSWSLGDNSTSTARNPSRTYASPGTYTVTLTVTDNLGGTDQHSIPVTVGVTPANAPPNASFTNSCIQLQCTFTDGSTDSDGSVTGWSWNFGDNTTATTPNPSHTYTSGGTYTVTLIATDDKGSTASSSKVITVTAPTPNTAPTAAFEVACAALVCQFTNRSTDVDGTINAWEWTFLPEGASAATRNMSYTYPGPGTYIVTLQVTDDDGATNQLSKAIAVTTAIKLGVTGQVDATRQYMTLTWSGATGTAVNISRDAKHLKKDVNDGEYIDSILLPGGSQYTYKLCEVGSTTICSNKATVTF